ncbi:Chromosome (plasmid) partitioning protein ParB / Stage 0 sporulation protein J [Anaerovibrio sp. JC8]|uniref:ParB/RepB/Spo0J family partition protein n=1 Tax=Anaerovibrio sp. JC8 TaxID=1240085 RepID=UPI000A0B4588|nr:ParB/RepB/Spo0J family partition protein [Anaerovibrio sp. JC8]ORT98852.1 Chromosome (plasmid) partitioning protein ParB / Stage 0 sporulation protein J [Anaerovibrio sp. JC8]
MVKKKGGLGRGLGALGLGGAPVGQSAKQDTEKKVQPKAAKHIDNTDSVHNNVAAPQEIAVSQIKVNPNQPRTEFDEEALNALQESIKEYGVIQPVIVRKTAKGYELIAGERRLRASKLAGKKTIPAIIKEYNDAQMTEIALIENIQRENLNPVEEAHAYQHLLSDYGLTQDMLSKKVGRSRSHIANFLRLLKLSAKIQTMLVENRISMGQAKPLLAIEDMDLQEKAAAFIIDNDLSVRKVEALVKQILKHPDYFEEKPMDTKGVDTDPAQLFILDAEDKLKMILGTSVRIKGTGKKKKLEIDFSSQDDLERIIELLTQRVQTDNNADKLKKLREFSTTGKFNV